jgi:small subunit ribosomal protein S20
MANNKSALKRDRQSKVRRLRNRVNKTKMKSSVEQLEAAVEAGSEEQAVKALQNAAAVIQKTASKGSIHRKTASRKISRLAKSVNRIQADA